MGELVHKCEIRREEDYLYFIDKNGDVSRVKMARGGKKSGKQQKVEKLNLAKEKGYLYYLGKKGVYRAQMKNAKVSKKKR